MTKEIKKKYNWIEKKTNYGAIGSIAALFILVFTIMIYSNMDQPTNAITMNSPIQEVTMMEQPTPKSVEIIPEQKSYDPFIVQSDSIKVYDYPNGFYDVRKEYKRDETVSVISIDDSGRWYQTNDGWVSISDVNTVIPEMTQEEILLASRGELNELNFTGINEKSNISLGQLQFLLKDTKLSGIEQAVLDIEEMYSVNAFFTIAVAKLESASGTSKIARNKNNLFGLNAIDGDAYRSAYTFDTPSDSVYYFGKNLERRYFSVGAHSISAINKIYCTSKTWGGEIKEIMKSDFNKIKR